MSRSNQKKAIELAAGNSSWRTDDSSLITRPINAIQEALNCVNHKLVEKFGISLNHCAELAQP